MQPQAKGRLEALEVGRGEKGFSSRASEGV